MPIEINGRFRIIARLGLETDKASKMVFLAYDLFHSLHKSEPVVLKLYVRHSQRDELEDGREEIFIHEQLIETGLVVKHLEHSLQLT
jgi:hypothetical protein